MKGMAKCPKCGGKHAKGKCPMDGKKGGTMKPKPGRPY